jgi:thiamine-phosphate pyrophosphorylase
VKLPDPPILLITDRKQAAAPIEDIVAAVLGAGCRWISIREKDLPAGEQTALARRLLPTALVAGARLTLHGGPELAAAAGLDGVHLRAGASAAEARAILGKERLVGISVHTAEEAAQADPAEVDYVIAGPAFETASKPGYGPALGIEGVSEIVRATSIPVVAIGGVYPARCVALGEAGVAGIAVMGGIMRASDPAREWQALATAMITDRA